MCVHTVCVSVAEVMKAIREKFHFTKCNREYVVSLYFNYDDLPDS